MHEVLPGVAMLLILVYRARGLTNGREFVWLFRPRAGVQPVVAPGAAD
jgi:hypothetical protein